MAATAGRRSIWWLATVPATTFVLGTWQLYRLQWKKGILDDAERSIAEPPIDLNTVWKSGNGTVEAEGYRRLRVHGTYDHARELYVGPRTHNGKLGVHVITPLRVNPVDEILVDRGFVPRERRDPATRPLGQVAGEVTVVGVARSPTKPSYFTPENRPERDEWYYLNVPEMAASRGTRPVLIAADAASTPPGGLPIGSSFNTADIRNDHLQYAATWYALSALTTAMVLLRGR